MSKTKQKKRNKQDKQKGGVYPKMDNNATLNNKKATVLIIGAGPVGLYLAYKFLISNVFSNINQLQCYNNYDQSFECAKELVIRIVEARDNLDKQFLRDFNVDDLNNSSFPKWWQLWIQGDTRGFADFRSAYQNNPRLRYFASRKQVFFINREILTSWDPWLRRLIAQISCGTTTTPNRWGILKCVLRGNYQGLGYSAGMEFPSIPDPFFDGTDSSSRQSSNSLDFGNNVGCSRTPTGGLAIEVGQLQIILLLAIKTRLAQMRGQLPGLDNLYPFSSPVNINYSHFTNPCPRDDDITCHNRILKNVVIDFAPAMAKRGRIQEEEILNQCKAGIYDMIFNCSGRTIGVPYKEGSVCVSRENNIHEPNVEVITSQAKDKVDPVQSGLITSNKDNPLSQPNYSFPHPLKRAIPYPDNRIGTMRMCKQYGSVMVIELDGDENTAFNVFAQAYYQHELYKQTCKNTSVTYGKPGQQTPITWQEDAFPAISPPSIADLMFQTDNELGKDKLSPCVGDSIRHGQNDARFFPSRGDGAGSGRIYLGLTITHSEAEAIRRAVDSNGEKKYFKNGGLTTNLKLFGLSEDPNAQPKSDQDPKIYDMIVDGIIMKYMFYAASVGISPYTVNWNTAEFSVFPLTLRRVERDNAAILQPWDNSYRFNANVRDITSSDQNPIEAHLPSNGVYANSSIYPRNQANFPQYPQVNQNTLQNYNGGSTCFVQVGDAAYSAHYFTGSGVNNGFRAVNRIFDILSGNGITYRVPENINSIPGNFWNWRINNFVNEYNFYINEESESYIRRVRREYASRLESDEMLQINVPIDNLPKYRDLLHIVNGVLLPQMNVSSTYQNIFGPQEHKRFNLGETTSFVRQHVLRDIVLASLLRFWNNPNKSNTRIGLFMWILREIDNGNLDNDPNYQAWLNKNRRVGDVDTKRYIQDKGNRGANFQASRGGKIKRKKTRKRRKGRSSTKKRKRKRKTKTINKKNRKKNTKRKKN